MKNLTNRDAIIAKFGKHVANQMEFRVQELGKLADLTNCQIVIDYKPSERPTFRIAVTHDPVTEPELQLFDEQ